MIVIMFSSVHVDSLREVAIVVVLDCRCSCSLA